MRAFIDANVFVHAWTLDVLLSAADAGLFAPHWFIDVIQADPGAMRSVMQELVRRKSHPPRTMEEEVAGLRQNRLARFSDWLEPLAG